ncbi:hypothetical protein LEP1GSC085_2322 [Leptospira interrogans str. L0996]|nr:hypothetical protein LEP1GSC085_2322 [Leptospira interrogans str. L0996]
MRIFTGLIYKLRDKQVHCIEEWEIPEILLCPNSDTILPPCRITFRVRVDEQGERIVSEEKMVSAKKPEVWLMGDSIAYGFGLNDSANDGHPNSTAAKLIADRISKEVISKF